MYTGVGRICGSRCSVLSLITIIAILIFIVALVGHHHLLTCFSLVLIILRTLIIKRMTKSNIESMNNHLESEVILFLVRIKMKTVS